ncbi:MD-2-related lipid-recognition domain-containing protein, partial [Irpex lacteus]
GWPDDIARIQLIELFPDRPEAGKNVTITAKVKLFEDIQEGAYADVQLKKGHMTPEIYSYDLCELGRSTQANFSCPIRAGNHTFTRTVTLPKNILPVVYSIFVGAYTVDGAPILCPHVHIDFRPPKLSEDD